MAIWCASIAHNVTVCLLLRLTVVSACSLTHLWWRHCHWQCGVNLSKNTSDKDLMGGKDHRSRSLWKSNNKPLSPHAHYQLVSRIVVGHLQVSQQLRNKLLNWHRLMIFGLDHHQNGLHYSREQRLQVSVQLSNSLN